MAVSRKASRQYLEPHGNKWRVVVSVPKAAQAVIGKTKLRRSLDTDSLTVANQLKWVVVEQLQAQIDRALSPQDHQARALYLAKVRRDALEALGDAEPEDILIDQHVEEIEGHPIGEDRYRQPIYDPKREAVAKAFADIAYGRRTPLDASRERYLDQLAVAARTRADDERAFGYLMDWCRRENVSAFCETFGQREAVRFFDAFEKSSGRSPVTLNKYIIRLGLYWKWMLRRGEVGANVWDGLTYRVPDETLDEMERPFSNDEMTRLLSGPTSQHMHDLMRMAALTGARLNVLVSLTVGDCQDGAIRFKAAKKEKSSRLVPMHPALAEIIERRTAGKAASDDLFPEWPPVQKGLRERSFKTTQDFMKYRRSLGVTDKVEGKRRDRVNFHSFRRWFITKAEQADQPENIIAVVVGHKRRGVTLGVYSGGPLLEQARRCVEAVQLPVIPDVQVVTPKTRRRRTARN